VIDRTQVHRQHVRWFGVKRALVVTTVEEAAQLLEGRLHRWHCFILHLPDCLARAAGLGVGCQCIRKLVC
jgi:hypothetical protein